MRSARSHHSFRHVLRALLKRICRESYNDPETLKRHGMDLVTVTDYDSIDALERLRTRPDFFVSEEVSAVTSDGNKLHIGVYDITEKQHCGLQARRNDFFRPARIPSLSRISCLASIRFFLA